MIKVSDDAALDDHPFYAAVDLLVSRHGITPDEARRRLEDVAENVGISATDLAELILLRDPLVKADPS